jgi:hydroxyacylglutathione hydrolase
MKLFYHFIPIGFTNAYLVGPDGPGDAILIDPGGFDVNLLTLIEHHGYYIRSVLVTHEHEDHTRGIKTIRKVYDAEIFAANPLINDYPVTQILPDTEYTISGFTFKVIGVPGHSGDSVAFLLDHVLFIGDSLNAGLIGTTYNSYAKALLLKNLHEKILTLPDSVIVLPGHGPPTTIYSEKMFNPVLKEQV